ncbi:MAG TPA: DUF6252 family protein, partial [Bacteroidia bacterium]|nr:DUF6252 family protein [Bacteroidia bacterium]
MKKKLVLFLVIAMGFMGCNKDSETPIKYFLKANIYGATWEANTSLFADQAIVLTVNGMKSDGSTLTMEINDVTPGTYPITNDRNHILYTSQLADAFESKNALPGSLVIISNDVSKNIIKGTFQVTVQSPLTG